MVVTETSNDVYDLDLYKLSSNQAALSWHRECIMTAWKSFYFWCNLMPFYMIDLELVYLYGLT